MKKSSEKPKRWQLQDAKAKLSRLVKEAQHGPQVITVHGEDAVVVQSMADFRKMGASRDGGGPNLFALLLKCPPGPSLTIERDPKDVVGAGEAPIFE